MNTQETLNHAAQIHEGVSLSLAFKSEPGQVIVASMVERLVGQLDSLVNDRLTDEQVLQTYYELRGGLRLLEDVGVSIRRATSAVMKNGIKSRLGIKLQEDL